MYRCIACRRERPRALGRPVGDHKWPSWRCADADECGRFMVAEQALAGLGADQRRCVAAMRGLALQYAADHWPEFTAWTRENIPSARDWIGLLDAETAHLIAVASASEGLADDG